MIPIKQSVEWKVRGCFFVAQLSMLCIHITASYTSKVGTRPVEENWMFFLLLNAEVVGLEGGRVGNPGLA